ncbi:MAG: SDR family oxidoreductase [Actinobacteria bacterium]|nr:SDR family oxidoreductase [Actinomycetota bacterium]
MSRVAIVTGAASGIGLATANALLDAEPDLALAAVDLSEIPVALRDRGATGYACDVADHAAVGETVAAVARDLGPPELLVNSAGIQIHAPALELSFADWSRLLAINLGGTFSFCQAAGRHMVERGRGAIVNLASISMFFGFPQRLPYIVSKCGVGGLTQTLAVEWATHGVRVNAVAPGMVETPILSGGLASGVINRQVAENAHAVKRLGTPEEIAAAIVFLLSDAASFVTGEILCVDGGFRRVKV